MNQLPTNLHWYTRDQYDIMRVAANLNPSRYKPRQRLAALMAQVVIENPILDLPFALIHFHCRSRRGIVKWLEQQAFGKLAWKFFSLESRDDTRSICCPWHRSAGMDL